MSDKRKILIVFDIDETLIQFIPKKVSHKWINLPENIKSRFKYIEDAGSYIIFRPYLQNLLNYLTNNDDKIQLAIWTYSDREYAENIANIIIKKFKLPQDIFLFRFGNEDVVEAGEDNPKNLEYVWKKYPEYNKFNTFLVDDRAANIYHNVNILNGVYIQPFAPFGVERSRTEGTKKTMEDAINDTVFQKLEIICNGCINYVEGCNDQEIEEAFTVEPIFLPKRVIKSGLGTYLKMYNKQGKIVQIMTIGAPALDNKLTVTTGGKNTRRRRRRQRSGRYHSGKTTKKNRKSRRNKKI